ncbi:uncharacterized protein LOC111056479 [Nilaparvata lugens]|uniref:uncharacterized protein LOC111056479 n=1 Tax=Nilaparvata lugens TaxID=108931 RepID=UPI00193DA933|nr:uncharacterized protein LOC111056479 [Nilaparvata lugens]
MVMCFVPDCKHYSEKQSCKFLIFPKDINKKKSWIKAIRRAGREPSEHSLICSCHFVDADKKNGPTIFQRNQLKMLNFPEVEKREKTGYTQKLQWQKLCRSHIQSW